MSRAPAGAIRRADHENLRRGVRYRIVVPDSARTEPTVATRLGLLSLAGADVRTADAVPTDALVVDGSVVVLPVGDESAGTAAFRLASVVTTTAELFERVWSTAVPLTASDLPDATELDSRERVLL